MYSYIPYHSYEHRRNIVSGMYMQSTHDIRKRQFGVKAQSLILYANYSSISLGPLQPLQLLNGIFIILRALINCIVS